MRSISACQFIIHLLLSQVRPQAPGDGDFFCTSRSPSVNLPSPNFKILLDSYHYTNLLPSLPGQSHTWQEVDVDNRTINLEGLTNVSRQYLLTNNR